MPLVEISKSMEVPNGERSGDSRHVPLKALLNLVGETIYLVSTVLFRMAFLRRVVYQMALDTSPPMLPAEELF